MPHTLEKINIITDDELYQLNGVIMGAQKQNNCLTRHLY